MTGAGRGCRRGRWSGAAPDPVAEGSSQERPAGQHPELAPADQTAFYERFRDKRLVSTQDTQGSYYYLDFLTRTRFREYEFGTTYEGTLSLRLHHPDGIGPSFRLRVHGDAFSVGDRAACRTSWSRTGHGRLPGEPADRRRGPHCRMPRHPQCPWSSRPGVTTSCDVRAREGLVSGRRAHPRLCGSTRCSIQLRTSTWRTSSFITSSSRPSSHAISRRDGSWCRASSLFT